MICCAANQPDCRHLEKSAECWSCAIGDGVIIDLMMDECFLYETPGECALRIALQKELDNINRQFNEFDEWRDRCIRGGIHASILVLIAYATWVVWMLS